MHFDLQQELLNYVPFDEIEAENVKKTLLFLNSCPSLAEACSRNHKNHLTASTLVVGVDGKILLNHHKKANIWIQFGGHCEAEDIDLYNTALREMYEETGFKKENILYSEPKILDCAIYEVPANRTKGEPAHKHFDINFLVVVDSFKYHRSVESTELRWCNLEEARLLVQNDPALLRMFDKVGKFLKNDNKMRNFC